MQSVMRRYLFRRDFFRKTKSRIRQVERRHFKDAFRDQKEILKGIDAPIILDVGANIGNVTKKYSRLFPHATIFAFEPFPEAFSRLQHACMHKYSKFKPQQYAVSDRTGDKTLYVSQYNVMNSLLTPTDLAWGFKDQKTIQVKTITLDQFCEQEDVSQIHICKLDIQGGELDALKGARKLLENNSIELIYTELLLYPFYNDQPSMCDLVQFLMGYGFSLFNIYNLREGPNHELRWCDGIFVSKHLKTRIRY